MTGWLVGMGMLAALLKGLLIVLLSLSIYGVIQSFRRGAIYQYGPNLTYRRRGLHRQLLRWLLVPKPEHNRYAAKRNLLAGCGFRVDTGMYIAISHLLALSLFIAFVLTVLSIVYLPGALSPLQQMFILSLELAVFVLLASDNIVLKKLQQIRRYRIMRDIDAVSRQLLYYGGLSGNLHGKLMRCLPLVYAMRSEWYQLTSEWYQNADLALGRFRERIATEEGHSFAETLNALRQYDHERYYELLRQRIVDYKEKLELFKESRKESFSYVLFVISGLPILYTFRLFIYPWVAEGQKLFESLG